jgi:phage anti-repressor protein
MTQIFSIELAQQLVNSSNPFPIEFDEAWTWLEYSRKDNAKVALVENFEEKIDYLINQEIANAFMQTKREKILLTIECLKMWGMMCGTPKGKEVRQYFLQCERIAKQNLKPKTALELAKERVELAIREVKLQEEIELQRAIIADQEKDLIHQAEVIDELFNYSSIIRIAKFNDCSEKAFSWRKLKAASVTMELEIKKVPDPNFGTKNLYSHDAWRFVYPEFKLPETTTLRIY